MKMLTDDNEIAYDSIKEHIASMPLPKEQIEDLRLCVDDCREFASCLPMPSARQSPIMAAFGRELAFFKCFKVSLSYSVEAITAYDSDALIQTTYF